MKKQLLKAISILAICIVSVLCIVSCGHTHTEETIESVPATCTKVGYTEGKKCSKCNEILVSPKPFLDSHTEEVIEATAPTCTENGSTEGKKCTVCGTLTVAPQPILGHHTEEIIPSVTADVEKTGATEGKKCSVCDEILVAPIEFTLVNIKINEEASSKGQITCDLVFDDKLRGDFTIYYGDAQKQKLAHFNKLTDVTLTKNDKTLELENIIIPNDCKYLIATDESEYLYFAQIPEEYVFQDDNYTFSSLSDVHINRGNYLDKALDFLDTYGNIDFVAISGDICDGEEKSYNLFNETISNRNYKTYTTTGNHDTSNLNNWLKLMNTSITTDKEVFDIAENGFDFVYIPEKNPDSVFVFFCQTSWDYSKNPSSQKHYIVTAEQLTWLEGVLEKYKDKTVLLYFHTFLSDPEGTQEEAVGNLKNPGGYSYELPFSYGSADEVKFRSLMKEYKNVIYFSGHSHWMFELETYNENLNVSNFDGEYCYMVHNPSVCEPRWIGEDDTGRTSKTGVASEGWIIEMYDDFMILIPVDFISQVFYTEYMEIIPLN